MTALRDDAEFKWLPSDWTVEPLGDLVQTVEYGSSAKSKRKGPVPVLRMGNLQGGGIDWGDLVFTDDDEEIQRYALDRGDVLFNRTNTVDLVGKTSIFEGDRPAIFAGYLIRVVTRADRLDPWYLNYVMNTELARRHSAKVLSVAVGQANINAQKLRSYPIPLPPTLTEQRAISRTLNDAGKLLQELERLLRKKRDLYRGVMQQLLSGTTRLPGFTAVWREHCLGDHVSFLRNGVNPRADLDASSPVRYLHYGDIHAAPSGMLDLSTTDMPRLPAAKAVGLDRLNDGDLIFADASEDLDGVGTSVEVAGLRGRELVSGLHTIAARFDKDVLADGFKGYLQHCPPFRRQLARLAQGTKVYATSRHHVESVVMTLPSLAEQRAIARVLLDCETELAALEYRIRKSRDLRVAMMQELLSGRTRLVNKGGSNA